MADSKELDPLGDDIQAGDMRQIYSEHKLRAENLPFDIDVWYPALQQFTFPTTFVPLTRAEAHAILQYQATRFNIKSVLDKKPDFTTIHVHTLNVLQQRLDQIIKTHFQTKVNGAPAAFMRLCGRSPKDGEPLDRQAVKDKYQRILKSLIEEKGYPNNAHTKLKAISQVQWLGVSSGAEAMSLLLSSERVFADLRDWIRYGEPEQVVFRDWEPELTLENEFRAFVNKNKITVISQYDHYGVYPELTEKIDKFSKLIHQKWQEVHPYLGLESYVMDFGYLPKKDEMIVIEVSPFLNCTGSACFKWANDREQMENGPFEFRLNTKTHPQIDDLIEANWEHRWEQPLPNYWDFYKKARKIDKESKHLIMIVPYVLIYVLGAAVMCYRHSWLLLSGYTVLGLIFAFREIVLNNRSKGNTTILFVYGTLKKNFHWNHKFLSSAKLISKALTSELFPLVVADSGVPYLLGDLSGQGKQIRGEIWEVDDETLWGLDEYEGISKGYYDRIEIEVIRNRDGKKVLTNVYVSIKSSPYLREKPYLEEYTLEFHKKHYNAVKHIQVKQELYLGNTFKTADEEAHAATMRT